HRNSSHRRNAQQVLQHQGSLFQRPAAGRCGGTPAPAGSREMTLVRAGAKSLCGSERGGIFFKLLFLIFLLVFAFVIYLVRYPILRFAGNFWVVDESPETSDAIVILSDDDYDAVRASRAADLFKASWAPRIVASGRFLRPYASIAELMQHDLTDRGVPESAVVRLPNRARNTLEEAAAVSSLLTSRGWKKILV